MNVKKITKIVIFSVLLSVSSGCLLKEEPEIKPLLTPSPVPEQTPATAPPAERRLADIEVYADNPTPVLDKDNFTMINLTIIGNKVTGGTSIRLGHGVSALYPDGTTIINPLEINVTLKPEQVVFPKTVNKTDPPYKLYSNLTIKAVSPPSDVDYFIGIIIEKLISSVQPVLLRVGSGGNVSKLYPGGCRPLSFPHFDLSPVPGARGVPVTANISITFSRLPIIVELKTKPKIEISNITRESFELNNEKISYHPARPLQPGTAYTVTVTYGQKIPPKGEENTCLTSNITWQFVTAYNTDGGGK